MGENDAVVRNQVKIDAHENPFSVFEPLGEIAPAPEAASSSRDAPGVAGPPADEPEVVVEDTHADANEPGGMDLDLIVRRFDVGAASNTATAAQPVRNDAEHATPIVCNLARSFGGKAPEADDGM